MKRYCTADPNHDPLLNEDFCPECGSPLRQLQRLHLYSHENMLRPRGSREKESLSLYIFEKLINAYDEWTSEEYGDSLTPEEAEKNLRMNLEEEVRSALRAFEEAKTN